MSKTRMLQRSFHGGVISPELQGRIELSQYQNGMAQCSNFIVLPHGALQRRSGLAYVDKALCAGQPAGAASRLIPFVFNNEQAFAIEIAATGPASGAFDGAMRFIASGGYVTVLSGVYDPLATYLDGDVVVSMPSAVRYVCLSKALPGQDPITAPALWRTLAFDPLVAYPAGAMVADPGLNVFVAVSAVAAGGAAPTVATVHTTPMPLLSTNPNWLHVGTALAMPAPARTDAYAIRSPYAADELQQITYTQSGDVVTLCHPKHPPMELRRYSNTRWALSAVSFAPAVPTPGTSLAVANPGIGGPGTATNDYAVAYVDASGAESVAAATTPATVTNDLTLPGADNRIFPAFPAPTGVAYADIYKRQNGLFGYIGRIPAASFTVGFRDDNITPDISHQPYTFDATIGSDANHYPAAVGYYEQRRWFAGWNAAPQGVMATRSGTEADMGYSVPTIASDRLSFKIAAREGYRIAHVVPVQSILMLTGGSEFRVASTDGSAISATTLSVKPQAYIGANHVTPITHNTGVLYAAARGGRLRSMSYSWQQQSYTSEEVAPVAPHLFNGKTIVDAAYQKAPYPIIWLVSSSGRLVALTYLPEQQIAAWHPHDTDGTIESVCSIPEGVEDGVYAVVRRDNVLAAGYDITIERFGPTLPVDTAAEAFHVDAGLTYSGAAVTLVQGLQHLEGKTVSILADGSVQPDQVVTAGTVTLPVAASLVHVGLPVVSTMQTLPFAFSGGGDLGQGHPKNVNRIWLRVVTSTGVWAGPDASNLVLYPPRSFEPWGSAPDLMTGELELALTPSWSTSGQVVIRQADPLPLTIVSLTQEVAVGGG